MQWDVFWQAATSKGLTRALTLSAVMTIVITVAQLVTSVLAAYAFAFLRFPLAAHAVRVVHGDAHAAHRGHADPQRQDGGRPRLAELGAGARPLRSWPPPWAPSSSAKGSRACRPTCATRPASTATATSASCGGSRCPSPDRSSRRSRCCRSSSAWNQYLWPQSVATLDQWQTAQVTLSNLPTSDPAHYNVGVAGAIIVALPVLVVLLVFQRQLVRGLTAGAVKG